MRSAALGMVKCDPFWTEQSGVCSDQFGNFLDETGNPVNPRTLADVLRTTTAVTPIRTAATTTAAPPPTPSIFSGAVDWLGQGYNAIYAAGGLAVALILFKSLMGGRR